MLQFRLVRHWQHMRCAVTSRSILSAPEDRGGGDAGNPNPDSERKITGRTMIGLVFTPVIVLAAITDKGGTAMSSGSK
jgi:hypothetical protein